MWIYRDEDGRLLLTQSADPPLYDNENERWFIDCQLLNKPIEITDSDTIEEFEELKFGDNPIQVVFDRLT